jgi:putative transcriptional regulator
VVTILLAAILVATARSIATGAPVNSKGMSLLVASPDLPDPMFAQSVILMLPSSAELPVVTGVIINKPTEVALGDLFQQVTGIQHPHEKAYFGGPVDPNVAILFTRTAPPSRDATRLTDKLYASLNLGSIAAMLTKPWSPHDQRLFLGRAQWSRDQLRGEMLQGAWEILPADVELVFSTDPAQLWTKLVQKAHLRQVRLSIEPYTRSDTLRDFFADL